MALILNIVREGFLLKRHQVFDPNSEEGRIQALLDEFPTVARKDGTIGRTGFAVHKIEAPDHPVFAETPRWYPPKYAEEIDRQIQELLKYGLIRPSKSPYGANIVLRPKANDGFERVVYFASKSLTPPEKRLSTPDKECLAIVWAINKFRDFLWGEEFTGLTDNDALSYLKTQHKNRRLTRWSHEIEEWGCKIMHIKGTHNVVADCLSRAPVSPTPEELDHLDGARDCYTPIFTAFVAKGFLERLKIAQNQDPDVISIVGKLTNPPLAMEDSSHIVLSHKERNILVNYCMQDGILHRRILNFRNKTAQNSRNVAILPSTFVAENAGPLNRIVQNEVVSSGSSQEDVARNPGPSNGRVCSPNQLSNSVSVLSNDNFRAHTLTEPSDFMLVPVLPISLRGEILNLFHDATEAGHMGVRKTQLAIKRRFFWDGMNKDIHEYVKSCQKCQEYKVERSKSKGLLGNVRQANAVFENIFIDFIGPYPASRYRRNKFCLVIVDQLSS
ncbi:Retrovirus-related Pol polyprotein from transposon opus [Folsomia candida]|uniref:RNA-directed DNA polymerase n=1 Tax=Folsomia candida TaxID=158441 RepID=A0A226E9G8_FOLCA|nr:Retrovirus-related Pol polyprotein from transposon opus [Folsomia candida]